MAGPSLTTHTGGAGLLMMEYYDRFFLDNLYPDLYLWQFGEKKRLPANSGKTVYFTKYTKYAVDSADISAGLVALTEGTAVTPGAISATRLTGSVAGYGAAVSHSDFLVMTSISDVITDSLQEISKVLALRMEQVIETAISAKGTVRAATNSGTSVVDTTPINVKDVIYAVTKLRTTDAKTFPDGNFVGRFHPNQIHDLMTDTTTGGWIDVNKYATGDTVGQIYRGEIGKLYGVRAIMSSNVPICTRTVNTSAALSAAANSGRQSLIFGPGAYGVVELDGGSAKTYIHNVGSAGSSDPLNQIATVGAKVYFGALDIDCTNRLVRIVSGYNTV